MLYDIPLTASSRKETEPIIPMEYASTPIAPIDISQSSISQYQQGIDITKPQVTTEGSMPTNREGTIPTFDLGNISSDDQSFLTSLGGVESRNNYYAKPNASGYEGKYQFRFRPGDDGSKYISRMGITRDQWRKSPELQEKMMRVVLKDYDSELRGRGIKVSNWTRWLRHNQGLGGATAILKGRLTKNIRRNIRNQGVSGTTDAQLIANYTKKFLHRFKGGGARSTKAVTKNSATPKRATAPASNNYSHSNSLVGTYKKLRKQLTKEQRATLNAKVASGELPTTAKVVEAMKALLANS